MTKQLIIFASVVGTAHADQFNTTQTQCTTEDGTATDGQFLSMECGHLHEGDCCVRCFDQKHDCVAVDVKNGCCYYFQSVTGSHKAWKTLRLTSGSSPTPPPTPGPVQGPTQLSDDLNEFISWSQMDPAENPDSVYTSGKGIMVRSPFDGFQDDEDKTVVPATLWVNDIMAPSQLYPGSGAGNGNPWCPTHDAFFSCDADGSTGDSGPWNYVQMAVVIGRNMKDLFMDFDNIQSQDWGWGVFYATDSNSVDKRCRWRPDLNGYDCPGGFLPWGSSIQSDSSRKGTGSYAAGNPTVNSDWGGGAGCHFDGNSDVDQTDAVNSDGDNLMGDEHCQCNYHFSGQWNKWVDNWVANGLNGQSYSWAADLAMCWTNNIRDMINLQNAMWWKHNDWNNRKIPIANYGGSAEANRPWWGWNEIPMTRTSITDISKWDAVMLKLPAGACGAGINDNLDCLDNKYYPQIESDLKRFVDAKYLGVGEGSTPSSNVIIAREYTDASDNFFREFFCQQWTYGQFKIVFKSKDSDGVGACFLDWASSTIQV